MILYHAGPEWAEIVEATVSQPDLTNRLCENHGFTPCTRYEPFGPGRGAVIAKRDHMLVMTIETDGKTTWFALAPSKELQDLLWSFSNGFAGQWSALELKAITGYDDWNALLRMAGDQFQAAVRSVERAIEGRPERDIPETTAMPVFEGDAMEVPADYLFSMDGSEMTECAH